ncbi:dihydroxyacetone kinase subunit DhaK [Aquimarina algicola]|uniref:DAK2 domain-containing protein n=1 Tax=Aquimarina algicola TaxID=2589995 RepID=A0A504J877_9FLAO|nr:dihydroxyacetone kinase subunit DhaK [Aquimarina algicola]TPN87057.1 DAK2 domain-containing protein [Aquimarina algicola]
MKRFFNESKQVVTEAIDGELRLTGTQNLTRADGFPSRKFVVRGDWDKSKVAIISGGGAGHEPAHLGFIGKGMLTAAISGEVFASPSVEAVLACILHVTGDAGCLLIVKNYTGDRLNFGLAAERAKKMGKKVEMVVVQDDIAIADAPQPRGIAGTLFVHKIAGYLSEKGSSLEEIKQKAEETAQNSFSLGLAISTCTLPGKELTVTDAPAELGLGIHGEPGLEKVDFKGGKEAVAMVLSRLFAETKPEENYALLINNLGAVTPLEMSIIANEVLTSRYKDQIEFIIGPALLMTSLNMYGFSFSLMKLTEENKEMLLAPVEPKSWPGVIKPLEPKIFDISYLQLRKTFEPSMNPKVEDYLQTICASLINAEEHLNNLDKQIGDGDTGSTFAAGANGIIDLLNSKSLPLNDTGDLLVAIGELLASHMGGSSGVLSSIMLTNAGACVSKGNDLDVALKSGVKMMMKYGGAKLGSRTMIDALLPAVEKLKDMDLEAAALAAREGANSTAKMEKAESGRSSYLRSESLKDVVDPGAEAIAILFESIALKLKYKH